MENQRTKAIFKRWIAHELVQRGETLLRIEPNYVNTNCRVFVFAYSPTLEKNFVAVTQAR